MTDTTSKDAHPLYSQFASYQQFLRERLRLLLASLRPALYSDVVQALQAEGKLLSFPSQDASSSHIISGSWSLLPFLIAQDIQPDIDLNYAGNVAIAVECLICALDLLDDVEDEDETAIVQTIGVPRVLNVATNLLMFAQKPLVSLQQMGIAPAMIVRLIDMMQEAVLAATVGQQRDLLAEQREASDLVREECIEIAAEKAGSLMRVACQMGAVCADADAKLVEQFSELGTLLGIAHQLDNDAHDLYDVLQAQPSASKSTGNEFEGISRKTDRIRHKKTLPVVLAAHKQESLQRQGMIADENNEEYIRALYEGIITTWGISLLYCERAHDCLRRIEERQPVAPALKLLLGLK